MIPTSGLLSLYIHRTFKLPQLTENNYGRKWPEGSTQITKEIIGFKANGKSPGFLTRYEHGLNLVRLLWPQDVALYKNCKGSDGEWFTVWNHFFMDVFKACCENKRLGLTGCASSGKTFAVAAYAILLFMSSPSDTSIMVSTTAGSDAERRVWGEIKRLHNIACKTFPLGTMIDYIKVITFDPSLEVGGKKEMKDRDIRNGIMLIPIPQGNEGDKAMGKIIGTKNKFVVWIIDELPHMIDNVLDGCDNLVSNYSFQLIGIGNAAKKTDPHGKFCTPRDGWDSVTQLTESWTSNSGGIVLNLNGQKSPNFHPSIAIDMQDKDSLPYPYLWNPISDSELSFSKGVGDHAAGRKTIGYARFAVGFWYGSEVTVTIVTENQVTQHKANTELEGRGWKKPIMIAGFDPGWSSGGDNNELCISELVTTLSDEQYLVVPSETIEISVESEGREDFRANVARRVVDQCIAKNVPASSLFMDINGDGGLMMAAITKAWTEKSGTFSQPVGLSSLEPCEDGETYANIVTEYWFQVSKAIGTGKMRGFNIRSGYARDLFGRQYESVGGGRVKIEKKADYKKRLKHSPDKGDSFCYMIEGAKRLGFNLRQVEDVSEQVQVMSLRQGMRAFDHSQLTENDGFVQVGHSQINADYSSW